MGDLLQNIQKLSVLAFLVCSMGAIGLALTPHAIAAPLRERRFVLLALTLNFVLAPAFAWLLTVVIPLERAHAAGLLLLGGAAGAPFLPKLVETARGDLAPAAALMALLTAGTILFLPFALPLMIPGLSADPWSIARPLLMLILLMVALNLRALLGVIGSGAILAALIFFTALFVFGWLLGGTHRSELGLATAARNFGAALAPVESCFDDPKVTVMIIVGAIVCLVVTFIAAGWVRSRPTSPWSPFGPSTR